jgi:hypothetical protein
MLWAVQRVEVGRGCELDDGLCELLAASLVL